MMDGGVWYLSLTWCTDEHDSTVPDSGEPKIVSTHKEEREGGARMNRRESSLLLCLTVVAGGIVSAVAWRTSFAQTPGCPPPGVDADGDGLCDADDACPASDRGATIVIDGCDTEVANASFKDGCTMADALAVCAESPRTHGRYVSCVARLTNTWKRADMLAPGEKGKIVRCAARANIPPSDDE
jgi:hypothetical protein